jgi:hypothetical protein
MRGCWNFSHPGPAIANASSVLSWQAAYAKRAVDRASRLRTTAHAEPAGGLDKPDH